MRKNYYIDDELIRIVQQIIALLKPGTYELSGALDGLWELIQRKTRFGIWFKQAAESGFFPNLRVGEKTVTNHQLYYVID